MGTQARWLLTLMFGLGCAASGAELKKGDWTYTGTTGPQHWNEVSSEFGLCRDGKQQSPVDLTGAAGQDLPSLVMHHAPSKLDVVNNGHTLQFNVDGANALELNGRSYTLVQFHVHHLSEHALDGKRFPLEVHLVHKSAEGNLAVIGVLFDMGAPGPLGALLNAPPKPGERRVLNGTTDPFVLLPADQTYFTYAGSLTTPPCSEGVTWLVLQTPLTASPQEILAFSSLFADNARPLQPLHERVIAQDTTPVP